MPDEKAQGSVATAPVKAEGGAVAPAEIADKKTPVTASPKQDSAPAETKRDTTAQGEKPEVKASDKATDGKQDVKAKFEFIKQRQKVKETKLNADELAKKYEEAQARIKELETSKAEPKADEDAVTSFLENPDKFLESRDNKVVERVLEAIGQSKREEQFAKAAADAESYLLTRSHIKDPQFATDVQAKLAEYQHIAQTGDMQSVAELAYYKTCAARGVVADDFAGKPDTSAKGSAGIAPSASDSFGGPKKWAAGEVKAYLDGARDIPTLKTRLAEIEKARNEGRAS